VSRCRVEFISWGVYHVLFGPSGFCHTLFRLSIDPCLQPVSYSSVHPTTNPVTYSTNQIQTSDPKIHPTTHHSSINRT